MSEAAHDPGPAPRLRQVVLALTRREVPGGALDALLRALARRERPELRAVFIEDLDLLNAVALPFTSEWCRVTNALRPIDRAHLEAHFARESAAAAAGVAALSRGLGWQCHFEVRRAPKAHVWRASLRETDAVLLPGAATARAATPAPVLALADGSDSGVRCLALADSIARAVQRPLEACVVRDEAAHAARGMPLADVPRQLARADVSLVLLAASLMTRLGQDADELDERCPAPLLLVR